MLVTVKRSKGEHVQSYSLIVFARDLNLFLK